MNSITQEKEIKKILKIAIPKGALLADSTKYLAKYEISFDTNNRKLLFESSMNAISVQIITVRPKDIITFLERGAVDLGIVGSDVIREYDPQLMILDNLEFGHCRLGIAIPDNSPINSISEISDYARIATKFPNLTRRYFADMGIQIDLVKLNGAIEIAPLVGLADAIVDLIGTGRTLRENNLKPLGIISEHTAHLVASRHSWQTKSEIIKQFMN